jgi:hypothetical protein
MISFFLVEWLKIYQQQIFFRIDFLTVHCFPVIYSEKFILILVTVRNIEVFPKGSMYVVINEWCK